MSSISDDMEALSLEAVCHVVELPVTFGCGSGTTRAMSRKAMEFTTDSPPAPGEVIAGHLRLPGNGMPDLVLDYAAEVIMIRRRSHDGAPFEVLARFAWLQFSAHG